LPLAEAGYHVVAPDHRGYGRTDDADVRYSDDLAPYSMLNHIRDTLGLVYALGHRTVAAVVGHDFGSPIAAWSALIRPDVFRSVVMMTAPFDGAPSFPFGVADGPADAPQPSGLSIHQQLAALPEPRKHYHWYYATEAANEEIWHPAQGVHDFLRAYYHMKSADWPHNHPRPLKAWSGEELAQIPRYYIMDLDKDMAQTVAAEMPTPEEIAACRWLTDEELAVCSSEYGRTGFQGGLQGYRIGTDPSWSEELKLFSGRTIDVPSLFISGASDWGAHQRPGRLERMQSEACTDLRGLHLLPGAGHWVQQEQPEAVNQLLLGFLAGQR
jgi:pimeloyl-ACP methyl ester carboxylesterase